MLYSDSIRYDQTAAEIAASVTPVNYSFTESNVLRYGAILDSSTDCTSAFQACANVAFYTGKMYIPGGNGYYKVSDKITLPIRSGLSIYGDGRLATRIRQVTASKDLFDSNNVWATSTNNIQVSNLTVEGAGVGRYGFKWVATSRSSFINVRFINFTAGVYTEDTLIVSFVSCHFDGNTDGILQTLAVNSIPNGFSFKSCNFENQSNLAINVLTASGWSISGGVIEGNLKGGINLQTGDGGFSITGVYFENNRDGTAGTYDINLGSGSGSVTGFNISGCRFQGSASDSNYYPVRVKNVVDGYIGENALGAGSRFISLGSTTGCINCEFGPIDFRTGAVDRTLGTGATFANIPAGFINSGNRITDYVSLPCDGQNLISGDFPLGSSSVPFLTILGGSSTFVRSPNTGTVPDQHNGRPVGMLTKNAGTATVYASWTVSATVNNRVRGNFVTFLIDVYVNNASSKAFDVILNDAASQTFTLSTSGSNATGYLTYGVCGYFSTSTTLLQALITAQADAEFRLSNPRVYVGLDKVTMPGLQGDPVWAASAKPTTGTWADGDRIRNSAPVAGATPGWVVTTPGTGGGALVISNEAVTV